MVETEIIEKHKKELHEVSDIIDEIKKKYNVKKRTTGSKIILSAIYNKYKLFIPNKEKVSGRYHNSDISKLIMLLNKKSWLQGRLSIEMGEKPITNKNILNKDKKKDI